MSGTAIVSHEILASATVEQVDRALAAFGDAEVHVVYSARDLGRQIPAEWQESIKHRSRRRFRAYVKLIRTRDQVDSDLWFWRVHSLPDVLRRWTRDVPPERVHLITVPPSGAEPEVLWRRFCQACGIDPSIGEPVGGRANASLGIEEIAVLRDLNKRLRKSGLDSASYGRLVREGIAQGVLAQRPDMRKAVLGPRHRDWAAETAEGWIAWVQEAGIDVVGDLDDLRPVFPPATEKWRNPDRPAGPGDPGRGDDGADRRRAGGRQSARPRGRPHRPARPRGPEAARPLTQVTDRGRGAPGWRSDRPARWCSRRSRPRRTLRRSAPCARRS